MAERPFNENQTFTKLEDWKFRVEKDTHASSDITPIEQMQLMASQMNQIKQIIDSVVNTQERVNQIIEWYNIRVWIMNNAKKELWLEYSEMEEIDKKAFANILDCDVEKLPKIDLSWLEAGKKEEK